MLEDQSRDIWVVHVMGHAASRNGRVELYIESIYQAHGVWTSGDGAHVDVPNIPSMPFHLDAASGSGHVIILSTLDTIALILYSSPLDSENL
jgi:hypothetical protein